MYGEMGNNSMTLSNKDQQHFPEDNLDIDNLIPIHSVIHSMHIY